MKFQTEPNNLRSIMMTSYPSTSAWLHFANLSIENDAKLILDTVRGIRSAKNSAGYKPSVTTPAFLQPLSLQSSGDDVIALYEHDILKLSNSSKIQKVENGFVIEMAETRKIGDYWNIFIPVNEEATPKRTTKSAQSMTKRLDFVQKNISKLEAEMNHEKFSNRVPLDVQAAKR